jgi:hypothetical protein
VVVAAGVVVVAAAGVVATGVVGRKIAFFHFSRLHLIKHGSSNFP